MSAAPFSPSSPPPVAASRSSRLWPPDADAVASPRTLVSALAVGVLAAFILWPQHAGSAYLLVGIGILLVALGTRSGKLTPAQVGAALITVTLLAVPLVRSAAWLVILCVVLACATGTSALVGGRTWTGLVVGACAGALAPARATRWVGRSLTHLCTDGVGSARVWLVVGATAGLVGIFGALFATADAAYASVVNRAFGAVDPVDVAPRIAALVAVTALALLGAYLAQRPPTVDALAPAAGRPVRRWEWVGPLVVLDLLFLSFVLVQLTVLFGGQHHVLGTQGLTYAQYARSGFWQLLVVTLLTLAVLAVAVRFAPRATASDRLLVRTVLALLCLLASAVVASALYRMSLYEEQFGFTRLRLFVSSVELTLGAVFVLLIAAGVRFRGAWLPRATLALAAVALLALAMVNPDGYIADRNVTRYQQTGRVDLAYLARLSPDAVPALDRLPGDVRSCALQQIATELRSGSERWYDVNLSRVRAQRLLVRHPVAECPLHPDRPR